MKKPILPKNDLFSSVYIILRVFMFLCCLLANNLFVQAQDTDLQDALRLRLWALLDTVNTPDLAIEGEHLHLKSDLKKFYEQRGYRPAWIVDFSAPLAGKQFSDCIARTDDNGLLPNDYHYNAIKQLIALTETSPTSTTVNDFLDLDLMLSDAFLLMAQHYAQGKVTPEDIGMAWHISKKIFNSVDYFNSTLSDGTPPCRSLEKLLPTNPNYKALQQALQLYRSKNDWSSIKYTWSTLVQRGYADPLVAEVRNTLSATGDLENANDNPMIFDRAVEQAVMRFQRRHGLYYDGVVRNTTLNAMNVSREERVRQIKANLERHRWMPEYLGDAYVTVNIPQFELSVFDKGELKYKEAVIVGRENYPTPSFSDSLQYIIFNPFWYMPKSIAKNELLPEIQLDPNYFINNGIKVIKGGKVIDSKKINWKTANSDDYSFAQAASAYNPMGVVKFMFPNPHDIYIHDTPSRELFDNSRRSFSHGCIRVKDPVKFASFLLKGDATWDSTRIKKVLFSQKETRANLPKPIPIHILYWTAFGDTETGELNFREDLYKWDDKLSKALETPLK